MAKIKTKKNEHGFTEKQSEAMGKLHAFMKKQSKDLKFTLGADLLADRVGRNGATPTTSCAFDLITGGGIPRHRLTTISGMEHSGKTTLLQAAMANQVQRGTFVHLMDFEGSSDGSWMKNGTGVDFNEYEGKSFFPLLDIPTGDDAFRYMVRTLDETIALNLGELPEVTHFFGLDSVPSLVPEDLMENDEAGDKPYIAIMLSKWLPSVRAKLKAANATFVAINQIRHKIRLKNKYECLHADNPIQLVDGRVFSIKELVDKKIEGEVWSHDGRGSLVPKKITNWFYNGESTPEEWVTLRTEGPGSANGFYSITVTHDHEVLTTTGWKQAQDIQEGESLLTRCERKFIPGSTAYQFLLGFVLGDCCIPDAKTNRNTGILHAQDTVDPEYLDWKLQKLKPFVEFSEYPLKGGGSTFVSEVRQEFNLLKNLIDNRNPTLLLEYLTPLSLAVWFMDDGYNNETHYHDNGFLSLKRFKNNPEVLETVANYFNALGYEAKVDLTNGGIRFNKNGFIKFSKDIAQYVPPIMQRKLREEDRGKYQDFTLASSCDCVELPVTVTAKIQGLSNRKARQLGKYDIEVEGTHNYLAGHSRGGLVVHNSPEYEPGGNAIRFLADMRVRVEIVKPKRVDGKDYSLLDKDAGLAIPKAGGLWFETNPDGSVDQYVYRKVKTHKNRVFPGLKETYMRICTSYHGGEGRGIDPVFDTLRFFEEIGYVTWTSKRTISLNSKEFDYFDIKQELEKPESGLRAEAVGLLDSGKAFELYFNRLGAANIGKPNSEDDAEDAGEE